ncbi:L-arabinose transport system permease protein AraP [Calidithermus terrae]|uniref:L-arabinose transport system permease protein AraP n=1 Tax=Calidithermus terrae TaxID=1408545 RepID=A0A399EZK5_9DEIN|nr:sugar ABC transporter permease [Calidithermus terrae]RIH89974.1 L-arabinose transport system permease protein AraP [Calidithermus terrae]
MQRSSTAPPRAISRQMRWSNLQRRWAPYVFISPFFILFLVFGLYPTLFSLYMSFQSWSQTDGWGNWKFVGLENYGFTFTDPMFWRAMYNTVWLGVVSGLPQHLLAIPLAFVIHMGLSRFKTFTSAVYFLPYITSTVAVALIFSTLFSTQKGVINQTIAYLNTLPLFGWFLPDEPVNWFLNSTIKWGIALVVIWKYTGWNTLLYLSAIQAIPRELYEAASVDGATRWQQFRFVTLPLLRPMMFFAVSLTIIGSMQLFEEPFVLLNGGASSATQGGQTVAMYMFRTAFEWLEMGTAASIAWLLFIVIAVLTIINNLVFGRAAQGRGE